MHEPEKDVNYNVNSSNESVYFGLLKRIWSNTVSALMNSISKQHQISINF